MRSPADIPPWLRHCYHDRAEVDAERKKNHHLLNFTGQICECGEGEWDFFGWASPGEGWAFHSCMGLGPSVYVTRSWAAVADYLECQARKMIYGQNLDRPCFPPHFLQEGPGFSPDGGRLFVREGVIYWANGDVTPAEGPQIMIRYMPCDDGEDYSLWTDDQRARRREEGTRQREDYQAQEEADRAAEEALVESARGKLTEEEFQAVCNYGGR